MKIPNLAATILITTFAITTSFSAQASMSYPRVNGGGYSLHQCGPESIIHRALLLAKAGAAGYRLAGISGIAAGICHPELFAAQSRFTN